MATSSLFSLQLYYHVIDSNVHIRLYFDAPGDVGLLWLHLLEKQQVRQDGLLDKLQEHAQIGAREPHQFRPYNKVRPTIRYL